MNWIDYARGIMYGCASALCLSLLFVVFASYGAINDTSAALKKTIAHTDELIVTANATANEARPRITATLDSVQEAADNGKGAMVNLKGASSSLKIAADKSQVFYDEQLAFLRSEAVQRTAAEALVGVRNFGAFMLNANLIARDFRLNTQPKIDEIIGGANVTVTRANELFARPSIPMIVDNGARLTGGLADTVELTNKRLPILLDDAHKLTFAAGGIAESIDIIGKGVVKPKSKKMRVLNFFLNRAIENAPILFARIKF